MLYLRALHGQTNFGSKENPVRFEKRIKRRKIKNFATDGKKMNIPQKDLILITRDLWGRLVYLAAVQNLEFEHVILYPMTMPPLSLTHMDGATNRTDKSSLMRKPEKSFIKSGILDKQNVNVCLIDYIYLLPILPQQLSATFGEVAAFIIKHACSHRSHNLWCIGLL